MHISTCNLHQTINFWFNFNLILKFVTTLTNMKIKSLYTSCICLEILSVYTFTCTCLGLTFSSQWGCCLLDIFTVPILLIFTCTCTLVLNSSLSPRYKHVYIQCIIRILNYFEVKENYLQKLLKLSFPS